MKKHNFFAGPAILPQEVKEKASKAALNYDGIGLSLMEISHRGKEFVEILNKTESHVRQILNLSDDYAVLFLTGGASTQFYMSALNLADKNESIAYIDTGTWSSKAIKEAKHFCNVDVIASSKDKNYSYIPKDYSVTADHKYLHITGNNTIFSIPHSSVPTTKKVTYDRPVSYI